jgi:predicted acylesterase/phospholipase RssA
LVILRAIQVGVKRDLCELVTKWYGTSTGATIGAGLLIQRQEHFMHAIQDVLDIYEFRSTSLINPLGAAHPARALYKLLDDHFGNLNFEHLPKLNVVTTRMPGFEPNVFCLSNNVCVAEALKASCAVPGVFDRVTINGSEHVDGFLVAKNPALLALQGEELNEDLILISLGTGILREVDDIEKQVRQTHLDLESLAQEKGFHYFRMNPHLELAADDMQNTSLKNIFNLRKDAENFLRQKEARLDSMVKLLNAL